MSAFLLPLGVPIELASDTAFLNLGTQTEGFATRPPEALGPAQAVAFYTCYCIFADWLQHFILALAVRVDDYHISFKQKPQSALPGTLGRHPIAILASRTALLRAENLSPVCLPFTSSLKRLNKALPAGVPLPTDFHTAGGSVSVSLVISRLVDVTVQCSCRARHWRAGQSPDRKLPGKRTWVEDARNHTNFPGCARVA